MNSTVIIGVLVAGLLVGMLLFIQADRSSVAEAPGTSTPAPTEEKETAQIVPKAEKELFAMATLEDLLRFPEVAPPEEPLEGRLYAVRLPQTGFFVVLRSLTESEYASFQVRGVGYEIIEREMLAAAFVLPEVGEEKIGGFSPELVTFLQQKINEISGFEVF